MAGPWPWVRPWLWPGPAAGGRGLDLHERFGVRGVNTGRTAQCLFEQVRRGSTQARFSNGCEDGRLTPLEERFKLVGQRGDVVEP
jgi:hypothetical protein